MSLQTLVAQLRYKSNWRFALFSGTTQTYGLGNSLFTTPLQANNASTAMILSTDEPVTFVIELMTPDSTDPAKAIFVQHRFDVVPYIDLDDAFWRKWLLRRILDVETHEAMEFFQIGDEHPFFPEHGPGGNLYVIRDKTCTS